MRFCEHRIVHDSEVMMVKTGVLCGCMLVTNLVFIVLRFIWVSDL